MITAASANGVSDVCNCFIGIMPITLIVPNKYTIVAISRPSMVARGIVFAGFATLPAGIVAHSIHIKAKNVKVADAVSAEKSDVPLLLKGGKFSRRINKN